MAIKFMRGDTVAAATRIVNRRDLDVVLLDLGLPDDKEGLEFLKRHDKRLRDLPVIILTGRITSETAADARKLGAFGYHVKGDDPIKLDQLIKRALLAGARTRRLKDDPPVVSVRLIDPSSMPLIGTSAAVVEVYETIGLVAPTEAGVLITGQSETSQEGIARFIHKHSKRNQQPFTVFGCAGVDEREVGELTTDKESYRLTDAMEKSGGGTLFLEDVDALPLRTQRRFLGILKERRVRAIGPGEIIQTNARLIAATKGSLLAQVRHGAFDEELFEVLNVVTIELPPLHKRREDIRVLVLYFIQQCATDYSIPVPTLLSESLDFICKKEWPGNIHQLRTCVSRAAILARGGIISPEDIRPADHRTQQAAPPVRQEQEHGSAPRPTQSRDRVLAVVLNGPEGTPVVLGREKPKLSCAQYDIIEALLAAGKKGLSKDEMDKASGHPEARKVLKKLCDSDADWAAVIRRPGKRGQGGYRITDRNYADSA
jgi:DNA-binding NtrC family response regulator